MQAHQEEEHFVDFSGRIVLECKRCGEALILFGLEEDWSSERSEFGCLCGGSVTLTDRQSEEVLSVKKMLRAGMGYTGLR